jgi:predicted DNA-binding transcriptional regulator YafY
MADEIRERQWHQDQKIEDAEDGGIVLELPVRSVEEARRFVLEYGSGATVLSPPDLVEDVRRQLEKMSRAYEGREAGGGKREGKAKGGR